MGKTGERAAGENALEEELVRGEEGTRWGDVVVLRGEGSEASAEVFALDSVSGKAWELRGESLREIGEAGASGLVLEGDSGRGEAWGENRLA